MFDDLVKHFDEHTVFMDVSAIEAGRDFRKAIEEGVTKCGVLLVVMGPEWLNAKDERGTRRLDNPADFVRIETSAALRRDIPVIPVLVRAAKMPSAEHLPDDLKELAFRNCMELTHARWKSDIQLLIEALRRLLGDSVQAGTVVRANAAAASAQTTQQETMETSTRADGSPARIDPATLQQISRELALRIGPIAGIVVKRAAAQCASVEDVYLKVAEEIDSQEERKKFLRGQGTIPSSAPSNVAGRESGSSNKAEALGLPPPSGANEAALKTRPPSREIRPSSRLKILGSHRRWSDCPDSGGRRRSAFRVIEEASRDAGSADPAPGDARRTCGKTRHASSSCRSVSTCENRCSRNRAETSSKGARATRSVAGTLVDESLAHLSTSGAAGTRSGHSNSRRRYLERWRG